MEMVVVFGILCGIVTAVIGSSKHRSTGGFFFLGLLLGPMGIVIALVMSKNTAGLEAEALQKGEMIKCPACGELNRAEANICRYCQSDLSKQARALSITKMIKCPACAELIKAEANICRYCQSDLSKQAWALSITQTGATNCPRCRGNLTLEQGDLDVKAFDCPLCNKHVEFA